jgi:hypothetical protein
MDSSGLLVDVTNFLTGLPPVGYSGFEGLVARLCEAATGQQFRLSASGQQMGQDAAAESGPGNRIKVECKRYRADSSLDARELTGEIAQAIMSDPSLDLWVLAASRPVPSQTSTALGEQAAASGVEVLFLDVGTDGLPRLAVLMAAYREVLRDWLNFRGYSETAALMSALDVVAASPLFLDARERLASTLAGTMLGYEIAATRCKSRLLDALGDERKSKVQFGQRLAIREPGGLLVPRLGIRAELGKFWLGEGNRAVVLGEEGSGKTWAVMDWLTSVVEGPGAHLVLAFTAGVEPISGASDLETLLPLLLRKWVGLQTEAFWAAKVRRWLSVSSDETPKITLVCDGLNERALNWPLFLRILEDPAWGGSVAVVLIDRPEHWRSQCSPMFGYSEIPVGGYSDDELRMALTGRGISLADIPESLHPLIRKPRYCGLVCEHFTEIREDEDFTESRLIWLDMRHRRRNHLGFPMSEDEFVSVIQEIALRYRNHNGNLDLNSVQSLIPCPDPEGRVYREILDGILERRTGSSPRFSARQSQLVYGLGMLVAEEIRTWIDSHPNSDEISDRIERWFEPHPAMELKVKICESALFHAFIDPAHPTAGRAEFLRYWLRLQNASFSASDAFVGYVVRAPQEFVGLAEQLLSQPTDTGRAESFFVESFCTYRDHPSVAPAMVAGISRWLKQVNVAGDSARHGDNSRREKALQSVAERIGREEHTGAFALGGFSVNLCVDDTSALIGLGFKIISAGSRGRFVEGLVCWALGIAINQSSSLSKEFDWLIRLSDDDIESPFMEAARALMDSGSPVGREAAYTILDALGTKEAKSMGAAHPLPESESQRRFRAEQEANPCHPWYAWSDEDCLRCMDRNDVHVDQILQRLGSRVFDPAFTISPKLIDRTAICLTSIPTSLRSSISSTREDHDFESLAPALSAHRPSALADFIRSVIRTMPNRTLEAQRTLCFWLPKKGPLLRQPEVEAVILTLDGLYRETTHWGPIGRGTVSPAQWIECFSLMGLLPQLSDIEFVRWTLQRPENSFDEERHEFLVRPFSPEAVRELLAAINADSPPNAMARALRLLCRSRFELSDVDRGRIVQLASSEQAYVRACCYRLAREIADRELRTELLRLDRYFGDSPWPEELAGSEFVVACAEDLPITEVAHRVHPAVLPSVLVTRGNRAEEVHFCGQLFDRLIRETLSADSPEAPSSLPRVEAAPRSRSLGIEMPEFSEAPEPPGPTNNDVEALREFFSSLTESHLDAQIKRKNQERWARLDAIHAAWKTSALNWYGRSFSGPMLYGLYDHDPT